MAEIADSMHSYDTDRIGNPENPHDTMDMNRTDLPNNGLREEKKVRNEDDQSEA